MLEGARRRAAEKRVVAEWVEGDMRRFDLGRRFSAVVIANNTLLHLETNEELIQCLAASARHLEPDGLVVFDVFNPALRGYGWCQLRVMLPVRTPAVALR